jgi:hypothetical protein
MREREREGGKFCMFDDDRVDKKRKWGEHWPTTHSPTWIELHDMPLFVIEMVTTYQFLWLVDAHICLMPSIFLLKVMKVDPMTELLLLLFLSRFRLYSTRLRRVLLMLWIRSYLERQEYVPNLFPLFDCRQVGSKTSKKTKRERNSTIEAPCLTTNNPTY